MRKKTEKSCAWSRFSKIGLNLVGLMDFAWNGLRKDLGSVSLLREQFSCNAAFDNGLCEFLCL